MNKVTSNSCKILNPTRDPNIWCRCEVDTVKHVCNGTKSSVSVTGLI